eukprot:COSAG01_NODE_4824_length_4713_cov_47.864759_5_plen_55_part_00
MVRVAVRHELELVKGRRGGGEEGRRGGGDMEGWRGAGAVPARCDQTAPVGWLVE